MDATLDSEKANRHSLLKQCKMESINIPMRKGGLDEVDDDGDDPSIEVTFYLAEFHLCFHFVIHKF